MPYRGCHIRGLLGLLTPLVTILLSITYSPWFNIFNNALSDLGNPYRSDAASIFNTGLIIGGIMIATYALTDVLKYDFILAFILELLGSLLTLIGFINESYGYVHFAVSSFFFIAATLLLTYLILILKSLLPLISLITIVSVWVIYFVFRIPKGIALPEVVSIASLIPWYLKILSVSCRKISNTIKYSQ